MRRKETENQTKNSRNFCFHLIKETKQGFKSGQTRNLFSWI